MTCSNDSSADEDFQHTDITVTLTLTHEHLYLRGHVQSHQYNKTQSSTHNRTNIYSHTHTHTHTQRHTRTERHLGPTLEHYGIFVIQDPPDFKKKHEQNKIR